MEREKCKEMVQRVMEIEDARVRVRELEEESKGLRERVKGLEGQLGEQEVRYTQRNTQLQTRLQ